MGLTVLRQVGAFGEVLSQQPVGVLVGSSLPGAVRIAEVDFYVGCQCKALVISQFLTPIPGERLVQFIGKFLCLFNEGGDDGIGILALYLHQQYVTRMTFD